MVVTDPKKLEEIRQREADITKERIELILSAGASPLYMYIYIYVCVCVYIYI